MFNNRASVIFTAFRDLFMCLIAAIAVVCVLLLANVRPVAKAEVDGGDPPGNVIVELTWPSGMKSDVDLWVQAPGDVPVGYSNKGGLLFNLLRDDLGDQSDVSDINFENSFTRGLIPGQYVVNVHLFRKRDDVPIPVKIVVSVKLNSKASITQILTSSDVLNEEGEELTLARFQLDTNGQLVPGTKDRLQTPLRDAVANK